MARLRKTLFFPGVILGAVVFAYIAYHRYLYPYGWSHCCDKILANELHQFAEEHDGWFPKGGSSPEASLSLLYRWDTDLDSMANLLRGRTVPESIVKPILKRGDLLSPETCGWHYVEGLKLDDNPGLALFWDKVGLGHNGMRQEGGHTVGFVDRRIEFIPETKWQEFLAEQEKLLAEVRKARANHSALQGTVNEPMK